MRYNKLMWRNIYLVARKTFFQNVRDFWHDILRLEGDFRSFLQAFHFRQDAAMVNIYSLPSQFETDILMTESTVNGHKTFRDRYRKSCTPFVTIWVRARSSIDGHRSLHFFLAHTAYTTRIHIWTHNVQADCQTVSLNFFWLEWLYFSISVYEYDKAMRHIRIIWERTKKVD